MYTTAENVMPNTEHLLVINQIFNFKVLIAGITAYLEVLSCF
jgi:hypothetical protein